MATYLKEIFIYPIKSMKGFATEEAQVEARGLRHDRRWMLVDKDGQFLTQREIPQLCHFYTAINGDHLIITSNHPDGAGEAEVALNNSSKEIVRVKIWSDVCTAIAVESKVDQFFSDILKRKTRLVFMPDSTNRRLDSRYAKGINSFSDAFPTLVAGTASLEFLNSKLEHPVGWDRFRPNLVMHTNEPFEEDNWKKFAIGNASFSGVKLAGRCLITCVNQQDAVVGKEPLRTLAGFRNIQRGVRFGLYATPEVKDSTVRVGEVAIIP